MNRLRQAALCLLPVAVFLWLDWYGLRAWFQNDDFAWLAQDLSLNGWRDWLKALFEPRAQGTLRVLSERVFFLALHGLAGLDHRPYHIVVAVTMAANLLLLRSVVLKLSGSQLAAVAAPLLWVVNASLATPLAWLSTYNQVLCAFFLLAAFRLLLGGRHFWQAVVFVVGFGAHELNVLYPVLALAYCVLLDREKLRRTLALLPLSALYAWVNFTYAPKPTSGLYARHWDLSMLTTFRVHLERTLGSGWRRAPEWSTTTLAWLLAAALVAYAVWAWRRHDRLPAFGWLWFLVMLGPVLPLRDQVMEYYPAIGSAGLAMAMACALRDGWARPWLGRGVAVGLLCVYSLFGAAASREITVWRWTRGQRIRALVEGIERAHELHPAKIILLTEMDSELFWSALLDGPSRVVGASEVYLAPGEEQHIEAHPELGEMGEWLSSRGAAARALSQGRAVVYEFQGNVLRNVTRRYAAAVPAAWLDERPRQITAGLPVYEQDMGAGWYNSEGSFRWMGARATLQLARPQPGDKLYVAGYCPAGPDAAPVELSVSAGGTELGRVTIPRKGDSFDFTFPLPESLQGPGEMTLELAVSRTVQEPGAGGRVLGLAIGQLGLR